MKLSATQTGKSWLSQFDRADLPKAQQLLDSMLLLDESQVAAALRTQLSLLAEGRLGRKRRVALYAEREYGGSPIFSVVEVPDANGKVRRRSVGRAGPPPVKPLRGSGHVGSEGLVANVISQACRTNSGAFLNHPGPDCFRQKSRPPGVIGIVTDFIGSGTRVRSMLDSFWAVPTVRSWVSLKWVEFVVISAAATTRGIAKTQRHRLSPTVLFEHFVPTLGTVGIDQYFDFKELIERYGPEEGRGAARFGFEDSAALVAFNYRLPNNTPSLLHQSAEGWRALYDGAAPEELRALFGPGSVENTVNKAATSNGVVLAQDLSPDDAELALFLSLLRGRWHEGKAIALSEKTGLPVSRILHQHRRARRDKLLTHEGRLTDSGQALLKVVRRDLHARPVVPTNETPYYPKLLRASRGSFRTSRP